VYLSPIVCRPVRGGFDVVACVLVQGLRRRRQAGGGRPGEREVAGREAGAAVLPFTPAQYEELEQQALIYKYLVAGVPVPPDLVVPIRRGLDSIATRFYGHPTRTYGIFLPLLGAMPPPSSLLYCFLGRLLRPRGPGSLFILIICTLPRLVNLLRSFVNP